MHRGAGLSAPTCQAPRVVRVGQTKKQYSQPESTAPGAGHFRKDFVSTYPAHLAHAIVAHPDIYRDHRDTLAMARAKPFAQHKRNDIVLKAVIHNSGYQSVQECKTVIDLYFDEPNCFFLENPKRAGNKIWGRERVEPIFSESHNCKDSKYLHDVKK
jgi:hypothetical protein